METTRSGFAAVLRFNPHTNFWVVQQNTLLPFSDRADFFQFKFLFLITLVLFSCSTIVFMFGFVGITQNFFLYFRLDQLRETQRGLCCIALLSRPGEGPRWRWAVRLEISSPSNTARGLLSLSPFCAFLALILRLLRGKTCSKQFNNT